MQFRSKIWWRTAIAVHQYHARSVATLTRNAEPNRAVVIWSFGSMSEGARINVMTMSGIDDIDFPMATSASRTEKLDLRLPPAAKRLLQKAAAASGRSVSEFVLESAIARAEETLPDRRYFGLDSVQWDAFQAALDAPPRALPRLRKLLQAPGMFERGGNE